MSTVKVNNAQIGQSNTASYNFTWYQPSVADGTLRLGVGNAGATSLDALVINSSGAMTLQGTANGVAYLNGSKVLTTGSALTFDGAGAFRVTEGSGSASLQLLTSGSGGQLAYIQPTRSGPLEISSESSNPSIAFRLGTSAPTSEQMRLTSTGLGIGTSTPYALLNPNAANRNTTAAWLTAPLYNNGVTSYSDYVELKLGNSYLGLNTIGQASIRSYANVWSNGGSNLAFLTSTSSGTLTEAMRLDSSGNLGLGVTPSAWTSGGNIQTGNNKSIIGNGVYINLGTNWFYDGSGNKYITTGRATNYWQADGAHIWYTAPSGTAGNAISFTQAMTLDASGVLLVNRTGYSSGVTNACKFQVLSTGSEFAAAFENSSASIPYGMRMYYSGAAPNGTGSQFLYCNDTSTLRMEVRSNGGIANYSGNNVNLSDRREKTNFAPAKSYLDVICAIPVQTFNYIDQNLEEDDGLTLGVVAQDVQSVAPELVMESNWGTKDEPKMRLSIYQTDLQYALMKCIQEQQELINQLTARVAQLEK